ncbi:MAG TPA: hypothetical protein VLB73_02340 [Patescibacteria group bacterium]|nr:hypothetical protein [Patescibacteria group bacterium]
MREEHHGGGFVNGFVLGLLVGAGIVFLLGTSKGKKILQMLLDQVEENTAISELLEMPEDDDEFVADMEEDMPVKAKVIEQKPQRAVAKVKRFFKGAPKKMVS